MGTGARREQLLDAFSWGRSLSRRSRRALAHRIEWVDLPPGAPIMARDASPRWVTFVASGHLEIVDGHSASRTIEAGGGAGVLEALHHRPFLTTVVVGDEGAVVGLLERRAFLGALQTIPDFAAALLRTITAPVPPHAPAPRRHRSALRWAA